MACLWSTPATGFRAWPNGTTPATARKAWPALNVCRTCVETNKELGLERTLGPRSRTRKSVTLPTGGALPRRRQVGDTVKMRRRRRTRRCFQPELPLGT